MERAVCQAGVMDRIQDERILDIEETAPLEDRSSVIVTLHNVTQSMLNRGEAGERQSTRRFPQVVYKSHRVCYAPYL